MVRSSGWNCAKRAGAPPRREQCMKPVDRREGHLTRMRSAGQCAVIRRKPVTRWRPSWAAHLSDRVYVIFTGFRRGLCPDRSACWPTAMARNTAGPFARCVRRSDGDAQPFSIRTTTTHRAPTMPRRTGTPTSGSSSRPTVTRSRMMTATQPSRQRRSVSETAGIPDQMMSKANVHKSVHKRYENGPRRCLRGPFCLVAGTGFEPATSGL
jgi:hypothetical protein